MHSKKGVELSVNFLVTLLLAITVLGFGIKFAYDIASSAQKIETQERERIDAELENLACRLEDRVCIGTTTKKVQQGKTAYFGVKVINVQNADKNFKLMVNFPSPCGVDKSGNQIPDCSSLTPIYNQIEFTIAPKESSKQLVAVKIPKEAKSGTYIVTVQVFEDRNSNNVVDTGEEYGSLQKIYLEVP